MKNKYIKIRDRIYIKREVIITLVLSVLVSSKNIYLKSIMFAFFHECSHLCIALILGFKIKNIKILINGFELSLYGTGKIKKLIVYLAGPVVSFLLCLAFKNINLLISKINFLIFSINILPALPLDGGRIFYCITEKTQVLKRLSRVCEIIIYSLAFIEKGYIWLIPVAILIHNTLKTMPYDIFVNDLVKRLEKEDKI